MSEKRARLKHMLERAALKYGDAHLSSVQKRIWLLEQVTPSTALHNIAFAISIAGQLNVEALEFALTEIAARHQVLHTAIREVEGSPLLLLQPPGSLRLTPIPLNRELADRAIRNEAGRPFDLTRGPLLRAVLFQHEAEQFILVLVFHHLVFDGGSIGVFTKELTDLYQAFSRGNPSPLSPLPLQYSDYASRQLDWLKDPEGTMQLEAWAQWLNDVSNEQHLPTDRKRRLQSSIAGANYSFTVPAFLMRSLLSVTAVNNATLFMGLLAAFKILVHRYTRRTDIVIGTTVTNRVRPELSQLIGPFVNVLPIRTQVDGKVSFAAMLQIVRESVLGALPFQNVPFEEVVNRLRVKRDLNRSPIFQLMFNVHNIPFTSLMLDNLELKCEPVPTGVAAYDLSLSFWSSQGELKGDVEYSTDLFDAMTVSRLVQHLLHLTAEATTRPNAPLCQVDMLDETERRLVLREIPSQLPPVMLDRLLHLQVERTPDVVAVQQGERRLSYQDLDTKAEQLAHRLREFGVGPEVGVGLLLRRSIEWITSMVAVAKTGSYFIPLDPDMPRERIRRTLNHLKPTVVLTERSLATWIPPGMSRLILDEPEGAGWKDVPRVNGPRATPDNLAYVIQTSGSTAEPKVVMITHAGICHRMMWEQQALPIGVNDSVLQLAAISFDASIWEALRALVAGARLLIPKDEHLDPAELGDLIRREQITVMSVVPSFLRVLLEDEFFARDSQLMYVVCAGEVLPSHIRRLLQHRSQAVVHNFYGPTEASIDAAYWTCQRGDSVSDVEPIGYSIPGMRIYVLDSNMLPMAPGLTGDIYIGGISLARGYYECPEITAEHFVPDPLSSKPGARLFKTRDRGRLTMQGVLEFLGRADHIVKVRGVLVELGEIESELRRHESVAEAVVIARPSANEIAAFDD